MTIPNDKPTQSSLEALGSAQTSPQATPDRRREQMVQLARTIEQRAAQTLTLRELAAEVGLSPSRLQKTFKAVLGVSPKAYQDAVRARRLKQALKNGNGVTDAIYESGYGSISRVYEDKVGKIGMTPTSYRRGAERECIWYACRRTALGLVAMAATERGVCFVQFGETSEQLVEVIRAEFPKAELLLSPAQAAPDLDHWMSALDEFLEQSGPMPDLPLDLRGTAFQTTVWKFLQSTRTGQVLTYTELAEQIGKPKAVRAVASACARNRVGVLIPCHRVLRGDGQLGGYRWGLERKRQLLDLERDPEPAPAAE